MKTKSTGAKYSAIVGIGEQLKQLEQETGQKYLRLNRGIPTVTQIDLSEVIPLIDFNSAELQVYPPNSGLMRLKKAINHYYFNDTSSEENIMITAGGMNGLDLIFKTLDTSLVLLPEFYWGAYANILKINQIPFETYYSFENLLAKKEQYKDASVIICDPNNPMGNKYDDKMLLEMVRKLNVNDTNIIWDSPYRKLFIEGKDDFYSQLICYDKVIVCDSFSKSIGLSGQRLGFVHSNNKQFLEVFNINLLYATNGINAFAQILVEKILSTPQGQRAAFEFREATRIAMKQNIDYLREKGFLAEEFYQDSDPVGIFTVVKFSEKELLQHHIGSVGLYYFTIKKDGPAQDYSRLCISVPHEELKAYFDNI
ncbi:MAG: pyridoxal phosphate-dependent aminotransferase [Bacteroidales bacterium]|nr:pyridoxal phosphate-dependent aminotransferase [Bacteroidales bacterium]